MSIVDLAMPKLGESIMEATILKWHKRPGDYVKMDETVLEIATDKVDSEVPATAAGEITEILYHENDVVPVGAVIAYIKTEVEETSAPEVVSTPEPDRNFIPVNEPSEAVLHHVPETVNEPVTAEGNSGFYSPLVLMIAKNEGISMSELENIPGTGNEKRVTKKDILQYVAERKNGKAGAEENGSAVLSAGESSSSVSVKDAMFRREQVLHTANLSRGNVEIIEMDRMRKLIADHMVRSKHTSAHVTSFSETDVTNLVRWRENIKQEFEKREGEKITFTPLFIEAIIKCIRRFPLINSSVAEDRILIKKDINIGMATALPNGNLIVPVIKNADQLNLVGITRQVNMLANAARNNKLRPEDTQDGTFTFTNVGTFGSLMGTPIINQPQVAILATGTIKKRPMVVETDQGDSIAIRHMMYLSLSYDHRIIDGSLGATFLAAVANELENFDAEREF
jgi:2-oxoglutarate dehydrogenase E2 component (dihydrolipoamide succinyltransferase)